MKLSTALPFATALSTIQTAASYIKGFNLGATNMDNSCKSQADWGKAFSAMQGLGFTSARVFASSDCDTLANAVPAAITSNIKILAGIWTEDDAHFGAEKYALLSAVRRYGHDWMVGVSVGSEDLYRNDTVASRLVQQIYDVRGMLTTVNSQGVPVGHVDTWTAWVNGANNAVIKACDFIGHDGYPYYQHSSVTDAYNVFFQSLAATIDAVNKISPGKPVWITETGWPLTGDPMGAAVASKANAQDYYSSVACAAYTQAVTFWFQLRDYTAYPSFGVLDANFNPILNLKC